MVIRVPSAARQRGTSMIEVLVTVVIVAFGLLGMAGLQMRMQVSELESYQRSQALMLLNDMANRIATNRAAAPAYVTGTTYGSSMACPTASDSTAARDLREWCLALQGAGETTDAGVPVGGMLGGRGCVQQVDGDYLLTVAWQGLTPLAAPPSAVSCGANKYDGSRCMDDLCRRVVTTVVRIAAL
jgi:type IV pilus assembly protein PilV